MTIEQMIKNGCTLEDAMDALDVLWEKQVAAQTRENEIKEKAAAVVDAYINYIKFLCPTISETQLENSVDDMKSTLKAISSIFTKLSKNNELQQKSKEQTNKRSTASNSNALNDFLDRIGW